LDPFVGIFTGVLAFYLNETNPRTAPADPEERFSALLRWKYAKWKAVRDAKLEAEEAAALKESSTLMTDK
jgi:hypothetical protein